MSEETEERLETVRECFDELVGMLPSSQRDEARAIAGEGYGAAQEIAENSQDISQA